MERNCYMEMGEGWGERERGGGGGGRVICSFCLGVAAHEIVEGDLTLFRCLCLYLSVCLTLFLSVCVCVCDP